MEKNKNFKSKHLVIICSVLLPTVSGVGHDRFIELQFLIYIYIYTYICTHTHTRIMLNFLHKDFKYFKIGKVI